MNRGHLVKRLQQLYVPALILAIVALTGYSLSGRQELVSDVYKAPEFVQIFETGDNTKPAWVYTAEGRLYVNYFGRDTVEVFNSEGIKTGSFSTRLKAGAGMPQGMAMVGKRLMIADYKNKALTVFDPKGKYVEAFAQRPDEQGFIPVGVAVYNRVFYVTDVSVNGWMAIGDDGELINVVEGLEDDTYLEFPYGIVVTEDGRVLISDPRGGKIKVFACPGWFAYDFPIREVGIKNPQGLAIDGLGRIHVVDNGTNKVFVFDNRGKFLFKYGNRLIGPTTITIDKEKRLIYIANTDKSNISVWKY